MSWKLSLFLSNFTSLNVIDTIELNVQWPSFVSYRQQSIIFSWVCAVGDENFFNMIDYVQPELSNALAFPSPSLRIFYKNTQVCVLLVVLSNSLFLWNLSSFWTDMQRYVYFSAALELIFCLLGFILESFQFVGSDGVNLIVWIVTIVSFVLLIDVHLLNRSQSFGYQTLSQCIWTLPKYTYNRVQPLLVVITLAQSI